MSKWKKWFGGNEEIDVEGDTNALWIDLARRNNYPTYRSSRHSGGLNSYRIGLYYTYPGMNGYTSYLQLILKCKLIVSLKNSFTFTRINL